MFHNLCYNELRVAPEEHPVFLIDNPAPTVITRDFLTQDVFESFNVPAIYIASSQYVSLLRGCGDSASGLVLDCGDSNTYIQAYYVHSHPHASLFLSFSLSFPSLTLSHTLSLSLTHTHSLTQTLSLSHTLSHTFSHSHTHSLLPLSLSHTLSHTLSLSLSLTHTHNKDGMPISASTRFSDIGGRHLRENLWKQLESLPLSEEKLAETLRDTIGRHSINGRLKNPVDSMSNEEIEAVLNKGGFCRERKLTRFSQTTLSPQVGSEGRLAKTLKDFLESDNNRRLLYDMNRSLMEQSCFISSSFDQTLAVYQQLKTPPFGHVCFDPSKLPRNPAFPSSIHSHSPLLSHSHLPP